MKTTHKDFSFYFALLIMVLCILMLAWAGETIPKTQHPSIEIQNDSLDGHTSSLTYYGTEFSKKTGYTQIKFVLDADTESTEYYIPLSFLEKCNTRCKNINEISSTTHSTSGNIVDDKIIVKSNSGVATLKMTADQYVQVYITVFRR